MAKTNQATDEAVSVSVLGEVKTKTLKRCPDCHATKFQGPFPIGQFVNGVFVAEEDIFTCRGCHRNGPVSGLDDFTVTIN